MATCQLLTVTEKLDEMIIDVITDLRRIVKITEYKRADCENFHKEIGKTTDFNNISKEDIMNRINILLIDEKILNEKIET